jgi:cell division protein FtsI/penicillin-binding protein 2
MSKRIKIRAYLVFFFVFIAYLGIVAKLYRVQIRDHEKYKLAALRRHNKPIKIHGERGNILDRNGEILAYSKNVVDYLAYAAMLNDTTRKKIAKRFSEVFGKPEKHYLKLMSKKKGIVWLERNVALNEAIKLSEFSVEGLKKEERFSRNYPLGHVAAHVVGFLNKEGKAVNGVERRYDKFLRGKDGYILVERDALGKICAVDEKRSVPPTKGDDVYLTIDVTFQKILEKALADGVKYYKGKSAIGIIEDPNTGEVLAMANIPNFDPNKYNIFNAYARKNRAITDAYEPGSTMKSVFMSVLINEGKVSENEKIYVENGSFVFKGRRISDTHKFKVLTVREILAHSSNIGMAKLSERIDASVLYKYLRDFGFGNKTGIDLPGEARGELRKPRSFTATTKSSVSRGYAISVTPIQLTTAYSALVNGGELLRPFVVKEVVENGKKVLKNEPEKIRRVIDEQTSVTIKDWLVDVVETGTAQRAQFNDMLVGGKTGTAQVLVNGEYSANEYYASFVGYFPAESPEYVCYIWMEKPQREKYGGSVAAPIFKRVVSEILEAHPEIVPERKKIIREKDGYEKLFAHSPKKNGSEKILVSADVKPRTTKKIKISGVNASVMPDLRGKSKREAIAVLNMLGLKYKFNGHGRITKQSVKPGSKIREGIVVELACGR